MNKTMNKTNHDIIITTPITITIRSLSDSNSLSHKQVPHTHSMRRHTFSKVLAIVALVGLFLLM